MTGRRCELRLSRVQLPQRELRRRRGVGPGTDQELWGRWCLVHQITSRVLECSRISLSSIPIISSTGFTSRANCIRLTETQMHVSLDDTPFSS